METAQIQNNNYVHIQPAGALEICRVVGVHDKITVTSINDPFENLQFDPADILPIQLTELWLKELSFETTDASATGSKPQAFVRNGVMVLLQKDESNNIVFHIKQSGQESTNPIKYVHELQNYYTAIKNEVISLP